MEGRRGNWIGRNKTYLNVLDEKLAFLVRELVPEGESVFLIVVFQSLEKSLRWNNVVAFESH